MPSTYTTRNRLEKQAPGENANTWGARLNTNAIDLIDFAMDGMTSFTLSGSKTLTDEDGAADESRARFINITSGTGGTVTIPNLEKVYKVRNACTGAVTFTTGSGTTAAVSAGGTATIVCEAGNVVRNHIPRASSVMLTTSGAGAQDYTAGALLDWDTEVHDDSAWHSTVSSPSRITVPTGVTRIRLGCNLALSNVTAGEDVSLAILKNAAGSWDGKPHQISKTPASGSARINIASGPLIVTAGDYFEAQVSVTVDTSVTLNSSGLNSFWAEAC